MFSELFFFDSKVNLLNAFISSCSSDLHKAEKLIFTCSLFPPSCTPPTSTWYIFCMLYLSVPLLPLIHPPWCREILPPFCSEKLTLFVPLHRIGSATLHKHNSSGYWLYQWFSDLTQLSNSGSHRFMIEGDTIWNRCFMHDPNNMSVALREQCLETVHHLYQVRFNSYSPISQITNLPHRALQSLKHSTHTEKTLRYSYQLGQNSSESLPLSYFLFLQLCFIQFHSFT